MFQATLCSSSGGQIVLIQHLVEYSEISECSKLLRTYLHHVYKTLVIVIKSAWNPQGYGITLHYYVYVVLFRGHIYMIVKIC